VEAYSLSTDPHQEAEILRLYHAEKWKVGTLAKQLGIHRQVVDRVISQAGLPKAVRACQPSMIDDYVPFIVATLKEFPTLTASRLHEMARARGYRGGPDHFRHQVAHYRPRPTPEAYLRLKTLPGEQAQVDWGHFGQIEIGRTKRPLMAFVMVLSYSRQAVVRFFVDARLANFLRGHEAAFQAFGGVPRVVLYDNLKSAVLERRGDAIRFHPTLLAFAAHYRYQPRPVAVARGNEKGRVERLIRYVRQGFFAARSWRDLDDLNRQVEEWCRGPSADRPCPEDRSMSVAEAFAKERPLLLSLPDNPFPTDEREEVSVGKTPYVRFDRNDYSVPHIYVRRTLSVLASLTQVRVLDGETVIATHARIFDKGAQVENPAHIATLVDHKRRARRHRGQDRLAHAVPVSRDLLQAAAERGDNLGAITAALLRLLDQYGAAALAPAIAEALARGVPHPNAVRLALERRRDEQGQPPPVTVPLPNHPKARHLSVPPASLAAYDKLTEDTDDE